MYTSLSSIMLGALCCRFRFLYQPIYPLLNAIKTTPVTSFITLAFVWLQLVKVPVFIVELIVLLITFDNVCQNVMAADHELLEVARAFRLGRWGTLRYIYLPTVAPYLAAVSVIGIGLAWKAGVSTEALANARNFIGGWAHGAKIYLGTTDLSVWTVVAIMLNVVLEQLLLVCFCRISRGEGRL